MTVSEAPAARSIPPAATTIFARCYRIVGYFGLMSVAASMIYGFRYDADAPWRNYGFNLALYVAFIVPHLILTRSWWKRTVWGQSSGSLPEREFYILSSVGTWLGLFWLHWPVPGGEIALWEPVRFVGIVGFLWSAMMFFQGATRESLDGLIGVPGTEMQFSHGRETPLFTDGPYAEVRHPMYRAFMLLGICGLIVHPNAGQLLWTALLGATFLAFISVEEAQLLAARGDDYRRYRQQTPDRLFRGIW